MTEQQKSIIKTLREQNFSYNAIAKAMGVTVATVKSYCQRSGLAGNRKEAFRAQSDTPLPLPTFCRFCGQQITQKEKVKRRIFCSNECRVNWGILIWNRLSVEILMQAIVSAAEVNSFGMAQKQRSSVATLATSDTGMKE